MADKAKKLIQAQYHWANHVALALRYLSDELNYGGGGVPELELRIQGIKVQENGYWSESERAAYNAMVDYCDETFEGAPGYDPTWSGPYKARYLLVSEFAARTFRIENL